MGTRGVTGFVIDGVEKIGYQQYDSYPDGVGEQVLQFLRALSPAEVDAMKDAARELRLVTPKVGPTPEQQEALSRFWDPRVSSGERNEWYSLLRDTQGRPDLILEAGFVEDHASFVSDSVFCEWGYIIDLDAEVLEIYKGFQDAPHTLGRFADRVVEEEHRSNQYYPIALVASYPLSDLPESFLQLERSFYPEDEE